MSAGGEELLIADSADADRDGLRKLFESQGYVCTAAADATSAEDIIRRKFFPVALVDLDFAGPGNGLDLIRYIRRYSAPTRVVLITGRRSFDAAIEAFRAGVIDVVSKRPDQVGHLTGALKAAVDRYRSGDKDSALLKETRSVLDDSFKIMLAMCRKLYGSGDSSGNLTMKPTILFVDEDQEFLQEIASQLQDHPWDVSVEMSGGSGLDKASTFSFQILAVRQQLTDLPGHMLIKSAQAQRTATLGLLYDQKTGSLKRYEAGKMTGSDTGFSGPAQLVAGLESLVDELSTRREERRYLQVFRTENGAFLKRYADLKARIDAVLN